MPKISGDPVESEIGFKVLKITEVLIYLSLGATFVQFLRHIGDADPLGRDFAIQNLLFTILGSSFFAFLITGRLERVNFNQIGGIGRFGWEILLGMGLTLGINIFIAYFISLPKYQVTPAEYYLFFFNSAILEEVFFRGLILNIFRVILNALYSATSTTVNRLFIDLNSVFLCALVFMFFHFGVYKGEPIILASTFLGGVVLGFVYVRSNNILSPMIAHVFNNMVATRNLLRGI